MKGFNSKIMVAVMAVLGAVTIVCAVGRTQGLQKEKTAQPAAATTKVTIDNFSFSPDDVTVAAGTTVTWVNHDDVPHTVMSNDKKIKSKALDTDDTFSFPFAQAGTYEYFCSLHPKMTAKVTVK